MSSNSLRALCLTKLRDLMFTTRFHAQLFLLVRFGSVFRCRCNRAHHRHYWFLALACSANIGLPCLYIVPSIILLWNCRGQPIVFPSGEAIWRRLCGLWKAAGERSKKMEEEMPKCSVSSPSSSKDVAGDGSHFQIMGKRAD